MVQFFSLRNPVFEEAAAPVCELYGGGCLPALLGYADINYLKRKVLVQKERIDSREGAQDGVDCLNLGAFPSGDKGAVRRVCFNHFFGDERVHNPDFVSGGEQGAGLFGECGNIGCLNLNYFVVFRHDVANPFFHGHFGLAVEFKRVEVLEGAVQTGFVAGVYHRKQYSTSCGGKAIHSAGERGFRGEPLGERVAENGRGADGWSEGETSPSRKIFHYRHKNRLTLSDLRLKCK